MGLNPASERQLRAPDKDSAVNRALLYLLTFYHALLFAVCLTNLVANSFALKGGNFYGTQLVSSDLLARWIFWSPLLLPFWIRLLSRALQLELRVRLLVPAAAASVAMNFPFAAIDLSAPLPWVNLMQTALRDGLVQPSAFLFLVGGIAALARTDRIPIKHLLLLITGSAFAAAVLKLVIAGPALPRLEDETGYHLQSLIFQSGALKGALSLPAGVSVEAVRSALSLAFVGQQGMEYYSLHLHGWPAFLSVMGAAGLAPFANILLWALNILLFHRLVKMHLPAEKSEWTRILPMAVFCLSPLLLFLSNTYMAHTLALTLSLIIVHTHERIQGTLGGLVWIGLCLAAAFALVLVRPQALAPLAAGLLLTNLLDLRRPGVPAVLRSLTLLAGAAAGYFAFQAYAENFGTDFPVNSASCNAPGFGPGHGCFPTYGTLGHTFTKTLFNTGDLWSRWNQELSPAGLPLALLSIWLWLRQGRQAASRLALLYSAIVVASVVQFGLFFHNGGESYHGRYLADSAFAMAMLAGILIQGELHGKDKSTFSTLAHRMIVPAVLILVPSSAILQIRGEYVHPDIEPFRSASVLAPVKNAVIVVSGGGIDAEVPDAFTGETIVVPRTLLRTYLNLGYGTLAATAARIGDYGLPQDASGNLLLGEMSKPDAVRLGALLGRPVYSLRFNSFEPVTKSSRYARFWSRRPPSLERISNAD